MVLWLGRYLVASGYGPLCAERKSVAVLYSLHTACALCLLIPTRAGRDKCRVLISLIILDMENSDNDDNDIIEWSDGAMGRWSDGATG